jgi:hypothetical protein
MKIMGGKQGLTCANGKCEYLLEGSADRIKFPDKRKIKKKLVHLGECAQRKPKLN